MSDRFKLLSRNNNLSFAHHKESASVKLIAEDAAANEPEKYAVIYADPAGSFLANDWPYRL